MRQGYVLVDYHNLHDAWASGFMGAPTCAIPRPSREKNMASIQYVIDKLLSNVAKCLSAENCLPRQLIIRLYGGWYRNSQMTEHAGMIERAIKNAPVRLRKQLNSDILLDLATSLIDHYDEPIHNTLQVRNNLPRISFQIPPERCTQFNACELTSLQRDWREISCISPGCPVKLKNAAKSTPEQKCVDVHLACDFLSLSRQQPSDSLICLVTNDYDLFPAIRGGVATSSKASPRLLWAFSQPYERKPFIEILDRIGVKVVSLA